MTQKLRVKVLTLFPEVFPSTLGVSLSGKGLENNIWSLEKINIRDFGVSKHKIVDDDPFGGGNGMLMRPDVLGPALDHALEDMPDAKIIYPSPRGEKFNQQLAYGLSQESELIFICGRFEGIDERIIQYYNVAEISLGDFVLSGGEIPTIAMLDTIIRLLPGILTNQDTLIEESFSNFGKEDNNLLEYPQYTRPAIWRGIEVPSILRSGNHKLINNWKREKALEITRKNRPDLINK